MRYRSLLGYSSSHGHKHGRLPKDLSRDVGSELESAAAERLLWFVMTSPNLIKLDTLDKLQAAIEESRIRPVLLFKHSTSCGISVGVFREVSLVDSDINLVVVQTDRRISNEIERRIGIRHESPQAIVLKDGEAVYHASHYDITADDINKHLNDRANSNYRRV
jgi:bacillithiol system protein YtxJ